MRRRQLLISLSILVLIGLIGIIGSVIFFEGSLERLSNTSVKSQDMLPIPAFTEVVVALQPLSRGTRITSEMVGTRQFYHSPPKAIADISIAVGNFTTVQIFQGQPIVSDMLVYDEPLQLEDLIVALQPISTGTKITSEMVGIRNWPRTSPPPTVVFDISKVIGNVAAVEIFQGQPLVSQMLVYDEITPFTHWDILNTPDRYNDSACVKENITSTGIQICTYPEDSARTWSDSDTPFIFGDDLMGRNHWHYQADGVLMDSMILNDDTIYFWHQSRQLTALNGDTGEVQWSYASIYRINEAANLTILNNHLLFWRSGDQSLCAIFASDGQQKWCFPAEGMVYEIGLLTDDTLSFASKAGYRYLVNFETGQELFREAYGEPS